MSTTSVLVEGRHEACVVTAQTTIHVVDTEPRTIRAVRTLTDMMSWSCKVYATGDAFLRVAHADLAGCAVLEALNESINGLHVQQVLKHRDVLLPLVFVSARDSAALAVRALRGGAWHFLHKPFGESELWDAIHEAVAFDQEQRSMRELCREYRARLDSLTEAELAVLERVAIGQQKQETAAQLRICVRTVELRRKRAMTKMGAQSTADVVRMVLIAKGHDFLESRWRPHRPVAGPANSERVDEKRPR